MTLGPAAGLVIVALVPAGCAEEGGPHLEAASPAAASRNATVMLTGERLCGAAGDCTRAAGEVTIGRAPPMIRAVVVSYAETAAQIVIPPAAPIGATALIATVNERSSNALAFEVLP